MTDPVSDDSTDETTTEGTTMSKSYADLRKEAEGTVDDDALKPLAQQHAIFDKKLTTVMSDDSIPLPTRTAVLDKLNADVDNIGEAHYSNRGGLARRADGGLALFAGGNASDNAMLQLLQAVAEKTGFTPEALAGIFQPLLADGVTVNQAKARVLASRGVFNSMDGYEVKDNGVLVIAAEKDELNAEFTQYKNDNPAGQQTQTQVVAPLPHGFDATLAAFNRLPEAEKAPRKTAIDKIANGTVGVNLTKGLIIPDDQVQYANVVNDIKDHSGSEEFDLHDGAFSHHKVRATTVAVAELKPETRTAMGWTTN